MGSCNQEIDASAGSLVWVRRQNGSWWPGRVVGLDELPASSKLPGARTPIRLLGREDGSMDWYNLEKSKRVKAFRCGEYDEIIQKAKDNARRANRRSIDERKYVRREDAILHALELEKVRYFDENYKLGSPVSNSITTADKNFGLQSAKSCKKAFYVARAPSSFEKSRQELTQSVVSIEHPDKCNASDMHSMKKKRRGRPNDSEDDATEGMKLTSDLEGLGLGMVIKCEPDVCLQTKGSSDLYLPNNASLSESNFDNDFSGVSPMNSSKDSTLTLKRKRSQVIQACENMRKKSRSLSLEKVFMGSTKTDSNSIYHHDDVGGQSILRVKNKLRDQNSTLQKPDFPSVVDDSSDSSDTSCEDNLFDTSENNCSAAMGCSYIHLGTKANQYPRKQQLFGNDFSGGFIDVPVVMEMENASDLSPSSGPCSAATLIPCAEKEQSNHCIQVGVVSQINEGLGDTCSTGSATHVNHAGQPIDMSASEWYSKGKRNLRYPSLSKNVDLLESFVNRYTQSDSCFVNRIEKDIMGSNSDESPTSDSSRQLTKCMLLSEVGDVPGDRKYKISSMHDRKHDVASQNCHAYSAEALNACNSVPYAQENGKLLPSEGLLGTVMPLRAPLPNRHIRLPSRYRDSQQPVSTGPHLYDVELNVQTSYQGNHRVPLVSLSSKLNGKAIVGHPITVDVLEDGLSHTSNINDLLKEKCSKSHTKIKHVGPKKKLSGAAKVRSPLSLRKSNHGKKLGISPRKIRRLSSLVVDKKEDRRRWVVEKIGGPAVSCIPLRLVFSRLNEALSNSRH